MALYWSSLLILIWLFMVCKIAQFGYDAATVCILIHRQLSAPMRKSSSIHSCPYDQNHSSFPLPQCHCRISMADTQTWPICQTWFKAFAPCPLMALLLCWWERIWVFFTDETDDSTLARCSVFPSSSNALVSKPCLRNCRKSLIFM